VRQKIKQYFLKIIRNIIDKVGGVLLSKRSFESLQSQRDKAALKLIKIEDEHLVAGLEGIIVSKDRALQLFSLLISYFDKVTNPVPLTIIYTASTPEHAKAYEEVKDLINKIAPNIKLVNELDGFQNTLINIIDKLKVKNVFFLVDDILFIRKVDLKFACHLDTSRYILSLRHSPNLTRSYTANRKQIPPKLSNFNIELGLLEFRWFEKGCEWSDPWSVDGHIFSTAEVRILTKISSFSAPNSYEGALKSFNSLCKERSGLCYFESKILNLPINRVQNEFSNLSGSISPEYLLEKWNEGLMLDTSKFDKHVPQSPHEEHDIIFISRKSI